MLGKTLSEVDDLPIDELLIWKQYLRDGGDTNAILTLGLWANVNIQASKNLKPEDLFPHLRDIEPYEPPAEKIKRRLNELMANQNATGVDNTDASSSDNKA